jgi:endogenous inhibitor of DNA gyrase (YacG/DUF329 family)
MNRPTHRCARCGTATNHPTWVAHRPYCAAHYRLVAVPYCNGSTPCSPQCPTPRREA